MSIFILFNIVQLNGQNKSFDVDSFVIEDGIFIEYYKSRSDSCKEQTLDNSIYQVNRRFCYSYSISIPNNDNLVEYKYFRLTDPVDESVFALRDAWEYVDTAEDNLLDVAYIELVVERSQCLFRDDYNQTVIWYKYYNAHRDSIGAEATGLVENSKNLWMHPPRSKAFLILETSPFPFVSLPLWLGKKYNWSLKIDPIWGSTKHIVWRNPLQNVCNYEVKSFETLNTDLGPLPCYKIVSECGNYIGLSNLNLWYNATYGFVRMEYVNINGTKISFVLKQVASD